MKTPTPFTSALPLPVRLQERPVLWRFVAVLLGTLVLALSSRASVPMYPVPMTLQTLAVTLIGATYGWRLGTVTIVAWLVEGALGLPVLAGGAAGVRHFLGPTGGYLLAFPVAGGLVGWLVERGWGGNRTGLALLGMMFGHVVCLVLGAAWLSALIGPAKAWTLGVAPFLLGSLVKSALGATVLVAISRYRVR